MGINNQRRVPRNKHDSVVEILDGAGGIIDSGRLIDISGSGAAFRTSRPLACGDKIRMRLRLIDKGVLEASAHVVWGRREGAVNLCGVKFDSVKNVYPTGELKKPFE